MRTYTLISTKEREAILKYIIYKTGPLSVTAVAGHLNVSKSLVSNLFSKLCREKVLVRKGSKYALRETTRLKALRLLFNLSSFDPSFFSAYSYVRAAGMYGSWAKGTNTEESDLDLWVKVQNADSMKLAKLQSRILKRHKDAKILFLDNEKLKELKSKNLMFYHSLVFGSIIVYGDLDEIYE